MSKRTRAKRALKEAKRLPSRYVCQVKPKPRELMWRSIMWDLGRPS